MAPLLTIDEALARVLARAQPLDAEDVLLADAVGRFLAEAARSTVDLPPFPSSAMDGFAVRAADAPGTLPIVARIAAGAPSARALEPGEAMSIATGGSVPAGADAVIPLEDVVEKDNTIEIAQPLEQGMHVRPRGGDVRAGDVVVEAGARIGPAQIGALAAAGLPSLRCARRPRAAVVTTGSELRRPGEPLGHGEIYEANGAILASSLTTAGADVTTVASVADDDASHRDAIERALDADVVVTSGGVSVGPHDLVRRVEADLGVEEVLWGVAVKPGKPFAFGVRGRTLVFGLPGNPVSSLVGFELFVRPAVLALQGAAQPGPRFKSGRLGASVRRNPARDQLVRSRTRDEDAATVLEPLRGQESHMIARAASADALALVPRGDGELTTGDPVRYLELV